VNVNCISAATLPTLRTTRNRKHTARKSFEVHPTRPGHVQLHVNDGSFESITDLSPLQIDQLIAGLTKARNHAEERVN